MEGKGGAGEEEHPFEIYHLDARNHVEDMIQARRRRETVEPFDFVYGDAFSDFFIPYHLVTREFTQKIKELLRPETGMYLINVIEIFDSGLFLGALHATLESVFPHVYILAGNEGGPDQDPSIRSTFILVASLRPLDLGELGKREEARTLVGTPLRAEQVADLRRRSKSVILTDDFSPVENLLEPVVRKRGMLLEAKAEAKPETKFEAESKSVEESPEQTGEGGTANHDANR